MPIEVDRFVAPFYNVTFILCGMVFCNRCKREASYPSNHPPYSNETYYEQAAAMMRDGWSVIGDALDVLCPSCAGTLRQGDVPQQQP